MKKKARPLTDSKQYNAFVAKRDRALEEILNKYLNAIDAVVYSLKRRTEEVVSPFLIRNPIHYTGGVTLINQELGKRIEYIFGAAGHEIYRQMILLRATSYVLSHLGQAEAIARALGSAKHDTSDTKLEKILNKDSPTGGKLRDRIDLYMIRLKNKILEAYRMGHLLEEKPHEILKRIMTAFPPQAQAPKFRRSVLKQIKETGVKLAKGITLTTGTADQETLDQMVEDYLADNLPADLYQRSPQDLSNYYELDDQGNVVSSDGRFQWEVEQETTQDFVERVRNGEIDAAKENGIEDLQWVAILDSKTDECCEWRDGLSSDEIEEALKGDHQDDDCDAIVPPAHFNCRCRLVPISKDMPDVEKSDFSDFDDWLTAKGNE